MIALFTDFGWEGPYVGLLKLAIRKISTSIPIIDLWHDVPAFDIQGAAYLLAAQTNQFPVGTVFVGVVDPGVGSSRVGLILQADEYFFVGPDNGLFDCVAARARKIYCWHITWQPSNLSASFHGRDLFAPIATMLADKKAIPQQLGISVPWKLQSWPKELNRIIYIDRYGNAMTGIRSASVSNDTTIHIRNQILSKARTFSDVAPGQCFWYENSSGLIEIAMNQGSATSHLCLHLGECLQILDKNTGIVQ